MESGSYRYAYCQLPSFLFMCHHLTLILLDIWHATFTMLIEASSPSIAAFMNKVNDLEHRERELRYPSVWSCATYGALSIRYVASECKIWLTKVHPFWTIFTNINCASPIGLDCISFTTRSMIQEKIEKHTYEQSGENLFLCEKLQTTVHNKFLCDLY